MHTNYEIVAPGVVQIRIRFIMQKIGHPHNLTRRADEMVVARNWDADYHLEGSILTWATLLSPWFLHLDAFKGMVYRAQRVAVSFRTPESLLFAIFLLPAMQGKNANTGEKRRNS
jgi:hypothetical protein